MSFVYSRPFCDVHSRIFFTYARIRSCRRFVNACDVGKVSGNAASRLLCTPSLRITLMRIDKRTSRPASRIAGYGVHE
ncbi:hypothetical protein CBM2605_B130273 [Cupriavidus neocaledonicus]|uniref:Uncharacterized protein n=1 Tax=Cupriavidus neocaledonicus TaxID=1040979 RepID=A0ABY1V887_9BURK|nr:hypothetical protein CBM2605_B130273 [Cupriavidus neocaledonicus]